MPPRARRQPGQPHAANLDADEFVDGVADCRKHSSDLTVAAFVNGQFDIGAACPSGVPRRAFDAHVFRWLGWAIV